MSQTHAATPDAAAHKGKGKLLILIGVFVFLLAGGGGAGWYFFLRAQPAEAAAEHAKEEPKGEPGIVPFDPFVVNLADPGGAHFLRLTLQLVVDGEEAAKELEENAVARARVRSVVLEFLTQQSAEHLITPEGKTELKKHIAEHAAHTLHETKVLDVLFSEFIVQF